MSEKIVRRLYNDERPKSSGMDFSKRRVTFPSNLHWHNFFEVEMITAGKGKQTLNGEECELKRGTFYIAKLTDFHKVVPIENLQLNHMVLTENCLADWLLSRLSSDTGTYFFYFEEEVFQILEALFDLCMAENNKPHPDMEYLKSLLNCLFLKVFKNAKAEKEPPVSLTQPLQAAVQYIHLHFRENPSLSAVSKIAHYNPCHFSTAFKKSMGVNYCDYLNALKVDYAKELLLSTNLTSRDVGLESGFNSHSNFLKIFKLVSGTTPTKFRKPKK